MEGRDAKWKANPPAPHCFDNAPIRESEGSYTCPACGARFAGYAGEEIPNPSEGPLFWSEREAADWLREERAQGNTAARVVPQWIGGGH